MNILSHPDGWTPLIGVLTKELGLIRAAVYGVVWRYCQMQNRVCYASLETMAEDLGIGRSTVFRHLQALCEAGYLEDLTPELTNKPHTYRDTGKIQPVGIARGDMGNERRICPNCGILLARWNRE